MSDIVIKCESPFPVGLIGPDGPRDLLNAQGLLNLSDPVASVDRALLNAAASNLNAYVNGLRNITGPVVYPNSQWRADYPAIAERSDTGQVLLAEIALFAQDYQVPLTDFVFPAPGAFLDAKQQSILNRLNTFYSKNIGEGLSKGFCSAFTNIFEKLNFLISIVRTVVGFIQDLENFDLGEFLLGLFLQVMGPLIQIANAIKAAIEAIVNAMINIVQGIAQSIENIAEDLKAAGTRVINKMKDAIKAVQDFFAKPNVDSLKDYVEKLITSAASAFENLDPVIIGLLMYRFCQLSNVIQAFLQSPVKGLQTLVTSMVKTQLITQNISYVQSARAARAGANRLEPGEKTSARKSAADNINAAAPSPSTIVTQAIANRATTPSARSYNWIRSVELKRYVSLPEMTSDEGRIVTKLGYDNSRVAGYSPLAFLGPIQSVTVRKDGVDTRNPGPGWTEVHSTVWLYAIRTARQLTGVTLIRNGFYPDGQLLSKGMGVEFVAYSEFGRAETVIAASRAGFKNIIITSNGVYAGLGAVAGEYQAGASESAIVSDALELHRQQLLAQNLAPLAIPE